MDGIVFNEGDTAGPLSGLAFVGKPAREEMSEEERAEVTVSGAEFGHRIASTAPGACLVITGRFDLGDGGRSVEEQVMDCCLDTFGYQEVRARDQERTVNVLLDSPGGSLDSAFKIVRYLRWYADEVNVYVPRQAKSASTLVALGADCVYLSPSGELGPLDTQIYDPRNPATPVSVLDCYQSVDFVRAFGVDTMSQALARLSADARGQVAFVDLLESATNFGIGAIEPMLRGVRALDMGAWGRSLQIGERYALLVLKTKMTEERAAEIAHRLVYGYTHHPYPIHYEEVLEIGLDAKIMAADLYTAAMEVVDKCRGSLADGSPSRETRSFIGFVTHEEPGREHAPVPDAERGAENGRSRAHARKSRSGTTGPDEALASARR